MADQQSFSILNPMAVTPAMIVATNVAINTDHAPYAAGTTYGLGARVVVASNNTIYESLQAGNVGKDPTLAANATWWIKVSPTNYMKCFDEVISTQTARASSISYQLRPGAAVSAFALLNMKGVTSVRVRMIDPTYGTVYDKTTSVQSLPAASTWWDWLFNPNRRVQTKLLLTDLPVFPAADLFVDITGGTDLAIGVMMLGNLLTFSLGVKYGAKVGITSYSTKSKNTFGDTVLLKKAFSDKLTFDLILLNSEVDTLKSYLTTLDAVACLWIATSFYESTIVYGFFKDFQIMLTYFEHSDASLEIEGLT